MSTCAVGSMPSTTPALSCFFDGSTVPGPGVNAQNFSVRWTRTDTYRRRNLPLHRHDRRRHAHQGRWHDRRRCLARPAADDVLRGQGADGRVAHRCGRVLQRGECGHGRGDGAGRHDAADGLDGAVLHERQPHGPVALTRNDPAINFTWTGTSPAPGTIPATNFSARWTQSLPFNAGVYQFTTTSDDGARVYVDGQIILNFWIPQGGVTHSVNVQMTAGNHTVIVEYYQAAGGASMVFDLLARPDFGFTTDTVVSGLTLPTVFAFLPDGRILFGQKDGTIKVFKSGALLADAVLHRLAGEHRPGPRSAGHGHRPRLRVERPRLHRVHV